MPDSQPSDLEASASPLALADPYRHLVESAHEHAMFMMDREGTITHWNPGAEDVFGYSAEEAVGLSGAVLFTEEDRAAGIPEEEMATARDEGRARDERWHVRKDGKRFRASGVMTAIRVEGGEADGQEGESKDQEGRGTLAGYAKIARDVTERQVREDALRESEAQLRLALNESKMGLWTADFARDGVEDPPVEVSFGFGLIFGSAGNADGWTLRKIVERVHPDDRPEVEAALERTMDTRIDQDLEYRVVPPEGSRVRSSDDASPEMRWVRMHVGVFRHGEKPSLTGLVRDITEEVQQRETLRQAKEEAEQASEAKSRFVANVSHELRTPLNAVIGYSDRFRKDPGRYDTESLKQGFERIHDSGGQLLNLINDILDLTKAESGRLRLSLEGFDLGGFVAAVAEEMRPQVQENGNTFEVEGLESVGEVCTDRAKLRQILYNLLSNAGKYTEEGTVTLGVAVYEDEDAPPLPQTADERTVDTDGEAAENGANGQTGLNRELVISVADTGIGLTEEEQTDIFEAFERAEDVEAVRGTGLGLQIVQNLCRLLGGRIEVESVKGEGSTFTARLPAGPTPPGKTEDEEEHRRQTRREIAASAAFAAEAEAANQLPPQQEGLVLVIDDDRDARMLMRKQLTEAGFDVETASTGAEGLEQAEELHPMAITLDVLMKGMDGWEVLSRLKRERSPLKHVPVVMITITPGEGHAFHLGASDHLVKPVSKERLTELLGTYRQAKHRSERQAEHPPPPLQVLLLEDKEAMIERLRDAVDAGDSGGDVRVASGGSEALQIIDEEGFAPDLVFLDLLLPEIDPFAFLESLRERPGGTEAAVIALADEELSAEEIDRLNDQVEQVVQKSTLAREDLLDVVRRRMEELRRRAPRAEAPDASAEDADSNIPSSNQ